MASGNKKISEFRRTSLVHSSLQQVWDFFSSPNNLARITPAYMDFQILSGVDAQQIYSGMTIKYKVKPLLGIPLTWITRIESVTPLISFKDIQVQGPYAMWEHEHIFEVQQSGVLMQDRVRYNPGFGILGHIANKLFIEKKLAQIFDYREQVINNIFPNSK